MPAFHPFCKCEGLRPVYEPVGRNPLLRPELLLPTLNNPYSGIRFAVKKLAEAFSILRRYRSHDLFPHLPYRRTSSGTRLCCRNHISSTQRFKVHHPGLASGRRCPRRRHTCSMKSILIMAPPLQTSVVFLIEDSVVHFSFFFKEAISHRHYVDQAIRASFECFLLPRQCLYLRHRSKH